VLLLVSSSSSSSFFGEGDEPSLVSSFSSSPAFPGPEPPAAERDESSSVRTVSLSSSFQSLRFRRTALAASDPLPRAWALTL